MFSYRVLSLLGRHKQVSVQKCSVQTFWAKTQKSDSSFTDGIPDGIIRLVLCGVVSGDKTIEMIHMTLGNNPRGQAAFQPLYLFDFTRYI